MALVDGEHYPPTTRWALATARAEGYRVVAALFVGGTEKVAADGPPDLGVEVEVAGDDLAAGLRRAIERHAPDVVLDLSDEPVLGYRERSLVAGVALAAGVRYAGPDFSLEPPIDGSPLTAPTVAVIGTGKRTGKTAIAGEAARVARDEGLRPVIVAMGRGGPAGPQVVGAGEMNLERLRELARSGEHASSDYLEDALFTGVTTVGARRAGGGLAGRPYVSNVGEAARLADSMDPGIVILEGSGAAVPPIPWDAGVLVCPASLPPEHLGGYLGPFRVLLSDLVVFTMGVRGSPPPALSDLVSLVRGLRPPARIAITDFRPVPLDEVKGKKVYLTTTAPASAGPRLTSSLEQHSGCEVIGISHHLSDRGALERDLADAPEYDVLLTELKAAAIDVAAERASEAGAEVVFVDNRAETIDGDGELPDLLHETHRLAVERASERR